MSMTPAQIQAAADLLWDCWQEGRRLAVLPEGLRPATRRDGYAIQARLESRSQHPLYGWKIAATSEAGQRHIAVRGPMAGRLIRERVVPSGAEVPFGSNHMRVAEAEFACRLAVDVAPRADPYRTAEVLDAVASLHPAIELPDSRFDDFTIVGEAQLIADNACAHRFVLGPAASADWRSLDLAAHRVRVSIGTRLLCHGLGANVLGDPRAALTWLVNELSGLGITLRSGQVVTTGTCLTPLEIEPRDHVLADFGMLGRVEVRIGT
jgi:2-keto-4-pentenoate hydratase